MSNDCAICNRVGPPLVVCCICDRPKKPYGRSAGIAAAAGYCDDDCPGYREDPRPSGLWPGERFGDSLGHMDWHDTITEHDKETP